MSNCYFSVERAGIYTTFQDSGYDFLQHFGVTTGGVIDNNLFITANKLLGNDDNEPVIEFAYQGPRLRLEAGNVQIAVTGNVHFIISKKSEYFRETIGECFQTYQLMEGDIIDILATKSSIYGYLSISGGFKLNKYNNSGSTLVRSEIGSNDGRKIQENQLIEFNKESLNEKLKQVSFPSTDKSNVIRVIEGPQENFFSSETINQFYNSPFTISKSADRMGIRLDGNQITSKQSPNIPSEGIVKGSVQVPGDGNPIVLMVDHPTIGGYPKIATVILKDIAKLAQLSFGKEIRFEKISIETAEDLFYENQNDLKEIFKTISNVKKN